MKSLVPSSPQRSISASHFPQLALCASLALVACGVKALWTVDLTGNESRDEWAHSSGRLSVSAEGEGYSLFRPTGTSRYTLQKHDSKGIKQWDVAEIEVGNVDAYQLEATPNGEDQIHIIDVDSSKGVTWKAFTSAGAAALDVNVPKASLPELKVATPHLVDTDTLLVVSTDSSLANPQPANLYLITIQAKLIFRSLSGIGAVLAAITASRGISAPKSNRRLNRY